ncbi:MAG: hypothetical protein EKE20_18485 [Candidatus Symbiopectobacterium sp. Dall1.0]|nr:hypothetical protein [Candidatus Symbiopectobacterium sp. Dall1.0]
MTGATSSYARKYCLNGLFGIDDAKDADTNEHKHQQSNRSEETTIDPDAECHNVAPRSPDEILKDFTAQAVDCLSLAELQAAFEEVWLPLRGTPHRATAKDVYDIRKSELEEAA